MHYWYFVNNLEILICERKRVECVWSSSSFFVLFCFIFNNKNRLFFTGRISSCHFLCMLQEGLDPDVSFVPAEQKSELTVYFWNVTLSTLFCAIRHRILSITCAEMALWRLHWRVSILWCGHAVSVLDDVIHGYCVTRQLEWRHPWVLCDNVIGTIKSLADGWSWRYRIHATNRTCVIYLRDVNKTWP